MADNFADKRYLVVDDFADMRAAIRSILRSLGVNRIDQARDGSEAILQMEKRHYEVVLCDYNLGPGKDGQQVLEEARHRHLIGIGCIFIMVTAENAREMVMGAMEYAPDSYLAKPFTKELFRTRLGKLFARKAHLAAVDKAMTTKDYGAALKELNRLIAAKPKNLSELLKLKAEVCLTANRYEDAKSIYEQILAAREVPWARLGLGRVLFLQKDYAQAEEIFTQLLTLDPNLVIAYDWLAKTQTARKAFDEAEATLQTAVRLSPRALKRQQLLGKLALSNGNSTLAEAAFDRAVTLAKHSVLNHPSLLAGLATSKSANQKHEEALRVVGELGHLFAAHPEATFYAESTSAIVKRNQGDLAGSMEAMEGAERAMARLDESNPLELSLEMIKTYAQLGEQEKAAALLQKAVANNHDDEEFLMEAIRVCHEAGLDFDAETAIRQIQQGVVETNNRGVRLIMQGEFDAAIQLLREAADEMPGNKTINLNVAKASIMKMEKMGSTSEQVASLRRQVERLQRIATGDWRLTDVVLRLQRLESKP